MKVIKILYPVLLVLGMFLLGLNVFGLFVSLRNPDIYNEATPFIDDITLSEKQFYEIISAMEDSDAVYVTTVTLAVNQAIAHYWEKRGLDKYNLRIPAHENFLLFLLFNIFPDTEKRYEFCNYRKAIERGVGWCSQESLIVDSILEEQGIQARIIEYPWLHVISTAQVDKEKDTWWVLDPDYGVVIEHDIQAISDNSEIIRIYYTEAGYDNGTIDHLIEIYSSDYRIHESVDDYLGRARCRSERASYIFIWVLPVFFIIVGSLPIVRHVRHLRFLI